MILKYIKRIHWWTRYMSASEGAPSYAQRRRGASSEAELTLCFLVRLALSWNLVGLV